MGMRPWPIVGVDEAMPVHSCQRAGVAGMEQSQCRVIGETDAVIAQHDDGVVKIAQVFGDKRRAGICGDAATAG